MRELPKPCRVENPMFPLGSRAPSQATMLLESDDGASDDATRPLKTQSRASCSSRSIDLVSLVTRECTCSRRACFSQFKHDINKLKKLREDFNAMDPRDKDG